MNRSCAYQLAVILLLAGPRLYATASASPADSTQSLLAVAAVPPQDAPSAGSIIGTVIDAETRLPIESVKVEIMGTDQSVLTRRDGQYRIAGLERGIFQIRAAVQGYDAEVQNNIRIEPGREEHLFFALRKTKKRVEDPAYSIESVPVVRENPYPGYPVMARRRRVEGTIWVKLQVNDEGRVSDAILVNSVFSVNGTPARKSAMRPENARMADDLITASLTAARRWRFQPAMSKGKPVRTWVTVPFKFSLEHGRSYRAR